MEKELEEIKLDYLKLNYKTIYNATIFIAIGMIIFSIFFISNEIYSAKKYCEDLGMEYKFKIPYEHLCNNKTFFKYSNGWDFSREINISEIIFP